MQKSTVKSVVLIDLLGYRCYYIPSALSSTPKAEVKLFFACLHKNNGTLSASWWQNPKDVSLKEKLRRSSFAFHQLLCKSIYSRLYEQIKLQCIFDLLELKCHEVHIDHLRSSAMKIGCNDSPNQCDKTASRSDFSYMDINLSLQDWHSYRISTWFLPLNARRKSTHWPVLANLFLLFWLTTVL